MIPSVGTDALEGILLVVSILQAMGSGACWLYTWNVNRNRLTQEAIKKVEERFGKELKDLELKYTALEGRINSLPTQNQMTNISAQVSELDGDMKGANAKLSGIEKQMEQFNKTAGRIEQYLLDSSGSHKGGRR